MLTTNSAPSPVLEGVANAIMACLGEMCDFDSGSGPVCGIDDSGVTRTFENRCMANLAYCREGTCKYYTKYHTTMVHPHFFLYLVSIIHFFQNWRVIHLYVVIIILTTVNLITLLPVLRK